MLKTEGVRVTINKCGGNKRRGKSKTLTNAVCRNYKQAGHFRSQCSGGNKDVNSAKEHINDVLNCFEKKSSVDF